MKQTNFIIFVFASLLVLSFVSALPLSVKYVSPVNGSVYIESIPVFNATLNAPYEYSEINLNDNGLSDYPDSSLIVPGLNYWYVVFYNAGGDVLTTGGVQYFYSSSIDYISPLNGTHWNTVPVFNATLNAPYEYSEINLNDNGLSDYPDSSLIVPGLNYWYVVFYNAGGDVLTTGDVQYFYYDTASPVITLIGGNETLTVGDVYTDKGATADDGLSGNLTSNITNITNVNTAVVGTYYVQYSVVDDAGNSASLNRTVIVNAAIVVDGGSSGGGGRCTTVWACNEWSECNGGVETRTCSYPTNYCEPTASKPIELRACTIAVADNQTIVEDNNANSTATNFASAITGAVIGTTAGRWSLGIIIFLILLGLAWWIVAAKKKRAQSNKKKK